MVKSYKTSIFIFTRDLRLEDNTTLIIALQKSEKVIPIFIFNPYQIDDKNRFKSDNCVQFMCESLKELDNTLYSKGSKLYFFYDYHDVVIDKLLKDDNIDAVFMNVDYTPFAKKGMMKF
jgi:Deoxyribodipyrimidine photolyase